MQGGQKRQPLGYTIVEVLIVLAVSSFMFLIAANFINGKQEKTAFTEGTNDMVSNLQKVLEDVTDGHYSDIPLTCTVSGDALRIVTGGTGQGTNKDCVFLGKLVHFYSASGGPNVNYDVYSLAAARAISGSLPNAQVASVPDLTTTSTINQNLEVKSMKVDTGHGIDGDAFSIGFAQSLGTMDDIAPDTYESGSQTVGLIYFSGGWGVNSVAGTYVQPAKSATLCITDGTRQARIFVGGDSNNSNDLSISVKQLGKGNCS